METVVVIVGAGPSGLATSACLNLLSIPNVILEREGCSVSLWKNRAYDRLNLHLAKEFCHLPHFPLPPSFPTFVPRKDFIQYMEDYVSHFNLSPLYRRSVESAYYEAATGRWRVVARNTVSDELEEHLAKFLVVATGENSEGFIPDVSGMETFNGEILHSCRYKSAGEYSGKSVLVVGCGNSGMEIAYDLSINGAKTSIVIRSPFHVLTRDLVRLGMILLKYLPCYVVDNFIILLSKFKYGDLSKYGIHRPNGGPFSLKASTGRSPVIDVGTVKLVKSGQIQVLPSLTSISGDNVFFEKGRVHQFDAIIFATGYRSTAKNWLQDNDNLLNSEGMPVQKFPKHWKGDNGLYCVGLARRGLDGVAKDAQNVANDINRAYITHKI